MLYKTLFVFTLIIFSSKLSNGQRRITNGTNQDGPKHYMVYFVRADQKSSVKYDAWICGGAIVSHSYIITAAACLRDVDYMYAIAGYVRYINYMNINDDPCTKEAKKKVIYTCVPKLYNFAYDKVEAWSNIDIGLAQVESAYNYGEQLAAACSYPVNKIDINYNPRFSRPDSDAFVLGWGHIDRWRMTSNTNDMNMESLQSTSTKIIDKTVCMTAYENISTELPSIIFNYMICADGEGGINPDGNVTLEEKKDRTSCAGEALRTDRCQNLLRNKRIARNNFQFVNLSDQIWTEDLTRRHGICQNDHGGPLVTWIGAREFLIGVASVFKIDESYNCIGPYLYTSTACNARFLDCVISNDPVKSQVRSLVSPYFRKPVSSQLMAERATQNPANTLKSTQNPPENDDNIEFSNLRRAVNGKDRLSFCHQSPALRGFDMVEKKISWKHHPDGPAANERNGDTKMQQAIPPRPIPLRPIPPHPIPANPFRTNPVHPNPMKSIPLQFNPPQQQLWNRKPQAQWNRRPQMNIQWNAKPKTNVQWNARPQLNPQLNRPWNARPQVSRLVKAKS